MKSTFEKEKLTAEFGEMMVWEKLKEWNPDHTLTRITDTEEQLKGRDIKEEWQDSTGVHVVFHEVKCEPQTLGSIARADADGLYKKLAAYLDDEGNSYDTGTDYSFIELSADIPTEYNGIRYIYQDENTGKAHWNTGTPSKRKPRVKDFEKYGIRPDGWYLKIRDQVKRGENGIRFIWFVYPLVEDIEEAVKTEVGRKVLSSTLMLQFRDSDLVPLVDKDLFGRAYDIQRGGKDRGRVVVSTRYLKDGSTKFSLGYLMPAFTRKKSGGWQDNGLYVVEAAGDLKVVDEASARTGFFHGVRYEGRSSGDRSRGFLRKLHTPTGVKPVSEWFQ